MSEHRDGDAPSPQDAQEAERETPAQPSQETAGAQGAAEVIGRVADAGAAGVLPLGLGGQPVDPAGAPLGGATG